MLMDDRTLAAKGLIEGDAVVRQPQQPGNGVVEISSLATQVKIMSGALTETLMAGLAAVWLARLFARRVYD